MTAEAVKMQIRKAFANARYPGDHRLRGSDEGDEPFLLQDEFCGKKHWQPLDARFIDRAPDGYGSALSFFSHAAFCFYMPAYLIADIDNQLNPADPVFHLTHGFEKGSASVLINPVRYPDRIWNDYGKERCAAFTPEQASAIVAYLKFKRNADDPFDHVRQQIDEALESYWYGRADR